MKGQFSCWWLPVRASPTPTVGCAGIGKQQHKKKKKTLPQSRPSGARAPCNTPRAPAPGLGPRQGLCLQDQPFIPSSQLGDTLSHTAQQHQYKLVL